MRLFIFLQCFFLTALMGFAQNAPINFEAGGNGANWTWTVFENTTNPPLEIIANPDPSGINTSATVAKFTALASGNPWAGCESMHGADLGPFVLGPSNSIIKIMVWKSVISDVGIKFASPTGWAQVEIKRPNTVVNQWEELTFDFSNYVNPPSSEGQLDQIIVFPDFNLAGRGQDNIIYFDNITFSASGVVPTVPATAAPTPPARNAADVVSVFSEAYAQVPGTDFNPGWGQSTIAATIEIQGNQTLRYANFNYQGTQFGNALNVSAMEKLHVDMWTADATTVNIFCISPGPVETAFALPVTPGQWGSYDIPLTAFANVDLANVVQFKFDGGDGTPTIYLDNLYFYKGGATGGAGPNAPITFEPGGFGADWTWTVFENATNPPLEIIANPDPSGINTSGTVAKFTALAGGNPWAGVESMHGADLGPFVLGPSNSTIKIMVWKSVISDVGIKLASPAGWAQVEIKRPNTVINQWEELTFDFSSYLNPPADQGQLDQIIVFPDFNLAGRGQDNIIYFDNITFGSGGAVVTAPLSPAPTPPARNAADVISVFSEAYAQVPATDFNPNWGQSTVVATIPIQGNQTLRYANFNYQGTQFANALNVSSMEKLHVDMWTANATTVNIFCISPGPVETAFALPVTPGQWVSYDIPLTAFANVDLSNVIQFKFEGGDGTPTIYLDNLYFYRAPSTGGDGPNAPINFEPSGFGANWTWTVFENATNPPLEIIANPDPSGINTSATVAKFTALAGGNPWAGVESMHGADLGAFVLSPSNSTIKIMVWKSVISDVGIKFASPTGWAQVEIKRPNTVVNQWEELTFDFSSYLNPPASEGQLDQIIVFPDFNLAGRGQNNIIYFDNITFGSGGAVSTGEAEALRNTVRVYPNPVASGERIQFSREVTQIEVFDMAGKRIVAGSGFTLNTEVLKSGVYVVKMLTQDGSIQTQKLVVQ